MGTERDVLPNEGKLRQDYCSIWAKRPKIAETLTDCILCSSRCSDELDCIRNSIYAPDAHPWTESATVANSYFVEKRKKDASQVIVDIIPEAAESPIATYTIANEPVINTTVTPCKGNKIVHIRLSPEIYDTASDFCSEHKIPLSTYIKGLILKGLEKT